MLRKTNLKAIFRNVKVRILSNLKSINESPIIILGNQKTGTSVITHLLADYGKLTKTVDIPELFSPMLEKVVSGELQLETFSQRYSYHFSQDVIKEPNLTFFYNKLSKIHPLAKYIFIVRDPRSNIRSILNRLALPGNLKKLDDTSQINPLWKNIFDADLWDLPSGNYVETLAHRWVRAAKVYENNSDKMKLIRYEDFNSEKYKTIRNLANCLGIEEKGDITGQLDVQYQPKGNSNLDWKFFFGLENLKKIEKICSAHMDTFGYSVKYL